MFMNKMCEYFVFTFRNKQNFVDPLNNNWFVFHGLSHCLIYRRTAVAFSGAPNDCFLPNALKRCFRLSGVLLKLCRLILGCAIKFLYVRSF